MLTMIEREEAAAAIVYDLMFRLLADYRRYGRSLRPGFVLEPQPLAELVERLETATGDCRALLRCKIKAAGDGLDACAGAGVAGGCGRAGPAARR
jgi:hypothetical protein